MPLGCVSTVRQGNRLPSADPRQRPAEATDHYKQRAVQRHWSKRSENSSVVVWVFFWFVLLLCSSKHSYCALKNLNQQWAPHARQQAFPRGSLPNPLSLQRLTLGNAGTVKSTCNFLQLKKWRKHFVSGVIFLCNYYFTKYFQSSLFQNYSCGWGSSSGHHLTSEMFLGQSYTTPGQRLDSTPSSTGPGMQRVFNRDQREGGSQRLDREDPASLPAWTACFRRTKKSPQRCARPDAARARRLCEQWNTRGRSEGLKHTLQRLTLSSSKLSPSDAGAQRGFFCFNDISDFHKHMVCICPFLDKKTKTQTLNSLNPCPKSCK